MKDYDLVELPRIDLMLSFAGTMYKLGLYNSNYTKGYYLYLGLATYWSLHEINN